MHESPAPPHDLLLLTKPGCHLCEAARRTVAEVAEDLGVEWREQSILDDAELCSATFGTSTRTGCGACSRPDGGAGLVGAEPSPYSWDTDRYRKDRTVTTHDPSGPAAGPEMRGRPIPPASVARLTIYLRALNSLLAEGVERVSSEELAEAAGVKSAMLRKDLSYLGSYGTRGVGY